MEHIYSRFLNTCNYSKQYIYLLLIAFLVNLSVSAQVGWTEVPTPDPSATRNMLRGISGTSSSDIWTVGSYEEVLSHSPYYRQHNLILHWNGSNWQQFPVADLSTTLDDLWDVEAISTNNVWATGIYNDGPVRPQLLHYNGSNWSNQSLPVITGGSFLYSLHALNANDIWAAGGKFSAPTREAYTIHYNGSGWSEIPVPAVGSFRNAFNEIHGVSSNDVWAVGHWGNSYGDYHALAMHWNGTNWSNVGLPSSVVNQPSEILNVKMVTSNDVWASGFYLSGGYFIIHWDGSSWTEVNSTVAGGPYAIVSANNVYSFGAQISHWDGNTWGLANPLGSQSYPSLVQTVTFSNGEIWAAGRTVDASNKFFTLVYRSVNNVPQFTGGAVQTLNVALNSNTVLPASVLRTASADVSQILTYSVVTAPLHGTLSGLPTTAITTNGFAIPTGVSYSPAPGYMGPDQFKIKVAAGSVFTETTINLNVIATLPVNLTSFQVSNQYEQALLKWTTASESNTRSFEVEHSTDGIHFSVIGTVNAGGSGSSSFTYEFLHARPAAGLNYYRIRALDVNGSSGLFPVKMIRFNSKGLVKLLGNPVNNNQVRLMLNGSGSFTGAIVNMQGQTVHSFRINNSIAGTAHQVFLPAMAENVYVLKVSNGVESYEVKFLLSK